MAHNSAVNLDISNLTVGFSIGGGTTKRTLTINGSGDTTLTSQQAIVLTLPNRATDTVVGYGDYSAKGTVLVGTGAGTFTALAVGSNGQVFTADSAQSSGTKWAAASGGGAVSSWVDVTGTTQTVAVQTGYIADNAGLVTLTLPATAVQGSVFRIAGQGAGGWTLAQNASQQVLFGNVATTAGVSGSLSSTNAGDAAEFLAVVGGASTIWRVISSVGNLTYV